MRRLSAKFRAACEVCRHFSPRWSSRSLALMRNPRTPLRPHRSWSKSAARLPVSPTTPLGVIATDPVVQQVLSQDFQVAGRLAGASTTSELTLTVTLTHRALEPGMALNEVAPGNGNAIALLKQAGVKPAPLPEQTAQDEDQTRAAIPTTTIPTRPRATRTRRTTSTATSSRAGWSSGPRRWAASIPPLPMRNWPVPPATAQQRSAIPPYMQPYQPQ